MQEFSRVGEETEAIRAVKALRRSLMEANEHLSKWMIEFEVDVNINTLDVIVTAKKHAGNKGWIKTIPCNDILYFKDDFPSLVREIVDEVFDVLLQNQMYNELHDRLLKASKNVLKMINK